LLIHIGLFLKFICGSDLLTSFYHCIYIMSVPYIHFVWDETKNQQNIRKHKVSFEEARSVFFDENARLINDPDHSMDEDRFIMLGISQKMRLLLVCHCYREDDEQIRIISARQALPLEESQYRRY
jgi:uncharacterized DUF497 family protein